MRRLVVDGACAANVFGLEPDARLSEAGWTLFDDRELMEPQIALRPRLGWPPFPPDIVYARLPEDMPSARRNLVLQTAHAALLSKAGGLGLFVGSAPCSLRAGPASAVALMTDLLTRAGFFNVQVGLAAGPVSGAEVVRARSPPTVSWAASVLCSTSSASRPATLLSLKRL
jgi:hypothetical protein